MFALVYLNLASVALQWRRAFPGGRQGFPAVGSLDGRGRVTQGKEVRQLSGGPILDPAGPGKERWRFGGACGARRFRAARTNVGSLVLGENAL